MTVHHIIDDADDPAIRMHCEGDNVDWSQKRGASRRRPLEHCLSTFRVPATEEEEPLSFTLAPPACTLETCQEPFLRWDRSLHPARSPLGTGQLLQFPQEPFSSYRAFLSSLARFTKFPSLGRALAPPLLLMIESRTGTVKG